MRLYRLFLLLLLAASATTFAQLAPVPVTGFNNDAVAEAGPSTLATTTLQVDGASSNKVMYTAAFSTFGGIGGGGLPDNGTIVNGADNYQLANYTGNNALYIYRNETRSLSLATPASYTRIRVLAFTTEGASSLNISLSFTDGSTVNYLTNYSLSDWFNGAANVVLQGFGRCTRTATAPWGADAFPSNPRMYFIDIPINCPDRSKLLQSVNFSNVSTFPNNAPFPNAVIMGLSGIGYTQTITPVITPSDCNGPNGSIALTVTGSSSPYTYSWNTTPVQTGGTATGLAPGNYTCTITDAGGCTSTYNGTVPLNNNAAVTASANPVAVCPGSSISLSATATNGNLTSFTWQPGNLSGQSVSITPASSGTYTVTATNAIGCNASATVNITVHSTPAPPLVNGIIICPGSTATLQVQSPQSGFIYNWYDAATGGTLLNTGASYTTPVLAANSTYYVEAISNNNCSSNTRTAATVTIASLPAAPQANAVQLCSGDNAILQVQNPQAGLTYNWYSTTIGGTLAGTGTSFTVNNVTAPATWHVEAVNATACSSAVRTPVSISLLPPLASPVVTLTNTTFTSLTFSWTSVPGATGYQVTTNGGSTYITPSSGAMGTTHIISGLTGNTTVTIQVRALGVQVCENSSLSAAVSGTTLSSKEIFVPNIFTPNGDGRNDKLLVFGNYVSTIKFSVFNQWGQLLFVSENINTGWDGSYKGYPQPIGVYAYTLKVVLQDGTIINKKGSFNLAR